MTGLACYEPTESEAPRLEKRTPNPHLNASTLDHILNLASLSPKLNLPAPALRQNSLGLGLGFRVLGRRRDVGLMPTGPVLGQHRRDPTPPDASVLSYRISEPCAHQEILKPVGSISTRLQTASRVCVRAAFACTLPHYCCFGLPSGKLQLRL